MKQNECTYIRSLGNSLNRKERALWRRVDRDIFESDSNHIPSNVSKRRKNTGFKEYFILYCGDEAVGRAAATVDEGWLGEKKESVGFIDDLVIDRSHKKLAGMLIDRCLGVLKETGVEGVVARSHGFPALAAQEFDDLPPTHLPCNPSWYIGLFEQKGFVKHKEWGNFRFTLPSEASPDSAPRLNALVSSCKAEIVPLNTRNRSQVKQYSDLTYEVLGEHYGYTPTRFMDSHSFFKALFFGLLCRIGKFRIYVLRNDSGEVVGFFSYHPDYNMAANSADKYLRKGSFNPLALLAIPAFIGSLHRAKRATIGSIGLDEAWRRRGFVMVFDHGLKFVLDEGYKQLDTGPVLIENAVVVKMAGAFQKKYGVNMERMTYYTLQYKF